MFLDKIEGNRIRVKISEIMTAEKDGKYGKSLLTRDP